MLKITRQQLDEAEVQFPGIKSQVERLEATALPVCPFCGSAETATVLRGLVGSAVQMAWASTKVKVVPVGPRPGSHFCNACKVYFNHLAP